MRHPILAAILGVVLALGCSDGKPKGDLPALQPTKGKVVRGGNPVGGGMVRFTPQPDDSNIVTNSEVKSDGTFELQTMHAQSQKKGPGAPLGTYKVTYYPPIGDQTAGPNPAPIEVAEKVTIKEGPNDVTVEVGKKWQPAIVRSSVAA